MYFFLMPILTFAVKSAVPLGVDSDRTEVSYVPTKPKQLSHGAFKDCLKQCNYREKMSNEAKQHLFSSDSSGHSCF